MTSTTARAGLLACALLTTAACNTDRPVTPINRLPDATLSASPQGEERPERSDPRSFFAMTDSALWAMGARSDTVFSVGMRRPGQARGIRRGQWLLPRPELGMRRAELAARSALEVVGVDSSLPRVFVRVRDARALGALRREGFVDYVEPRRLPPELLAVQSFGGCSITESGSSYIIGPTGDEVPTSYILSGVDRAWAYADGTGVRVAILDTGVNPQNHQLSQPQFTAGWSAGRLPLVQTNVIGGGGTGSCPHGTHMAAVIGAPRDGEYTQGVAWKANVHAITVERGVVNVPGTDVTQGVLDATNTGARVIAMALGVAIHSSALTDAIQRATTMYGIVVVAAAGTSPASIPWHRWFVVYPANLSEVMAVSAANYNGTMDNQSHAGAELDLVAYSPTTTSSYSGWGHHDFGNSSNATAITAGVAALVRQRYPAISEDSVRRRIIGTAGDRCGQATTFGPIINAEAAVGGICVPFGRPAGPPSLVFDRRAYGDNRTFQTAQYCVNVSGGIGGVEITWGDGSHGACRTVTFQRGSYTQRVTVDVRDRGVALPARTFWIDVDVADLDTTCPTCF